MDNISIKASNIPDHHKYILFGSPKKGLNTESSFLITNYFLKDVNLNHKQWKKEKNTWQINWEDNNRIQQQSKPINYLLISEYLRQNSHFDLNYFNLPKMECLWLDNSMNMKLNFHMHDHTGTFGLGSGNLHLQYGNNYPIKPLLNREGSLYTSFQPQLMNRIVFTREKLISNSDKSLEDDWVFDLRTLISDTISLIDITLTQLYIKAEYDALPNWTFNKNKLGVRHGRRLDDKLKWVFQITGNNLNIENEIESLNNLKNIRNHLMHFDPPSLVITIEESVGWLNQIIDIGIILIKLRKAAKAEISANLINFILQKEAIFNPVDSSKERAPLNRESEGGYFSSTWESVLIS